MGAADDLWDAVVVTYDEDGLIALTNVRDRSATTANASAGLSAAQGVIDIWPAYAQVEYDPTNALHVEVAKRAAIAMLWSRGGSSSTIAKVEWDEVFGEGGLLEKIRRTGARGRQGPVTNSGVQSSSELSSGQAVRGWSDRESIPSQILPSRRTASGDD